MSSELCVDLRKRMQRAASNRTTVQETWEEIEAFVTPYRGRFFKDERTEHSIEWHRDNVYDSTAVMAHQNLAASLHGSLTSPSIRWFHMQFRQKDLMKKPRVASWIEDASEAVHYALQDSNFNLEVNEVYQDLCGFATAAISLDDRAGELDFTSIPLKEAFFEEDEHGRVLRFFRKRNMTPGQMIAKYGEKGVPQRIIEMDRDGNQDEQEVCFSIYPRHNRIVKMGDNQVAASRRPWAYCDFLVSDCEMLGKEGGYYEMPVFIPRWRKTSESIWGHGPAHYAMADIKTLNRARMLQLIGSEKKIDPPIFAEERAIIGDLNLSSAELTVVRNIEGIRPFDTNFDIFVSREMIDQLQAAVRNYFFTDSLNYPSPQAQPMTATEAQIRYELMQRLLGPTLGRIQNDLLTPIVSRAFNILMRSKRIPEPPPEVEDLGPDFDIEYLGALHRAQKSDQAASVERYIMTLGNLAEVMPGLLDVVDDEEAARQLARDLSVPANILKGEDEVDEEREIREREAMRANEAALTAAENEAAAAAQQEPTA